MGAKVETMKAVDVVLDYTIYPRHSVDQLHIKRLGDALGAGSELPPITVEKTTDRAVDGVHRVKTYLQKYGKDVEISVIRKEYADDRELLLDAVALNSQHGHPLSSFDRERILGMAEQMEIGKEEICVAMRVTVARMDRLRVARHSSNGQTLKRTVKHMAGRPLNKRQKEANEKLGGMQQAFYMNQVSELLEAKLVNQDDEAVVNALARLSQAMEKFAAVSV